ncbi:MAG: DEAD/DEAH box helicase, partial [Actinomycetota bacterium]
MTERFDPTSVLSSLKDFQRATVDYVFKRMYEDSDSTSRFLVADEVGLGKTLVARGLIARAIEHLQDTVKRIDVIYVCSNAAIARQNVARLNVSGQQDFSLPDRITLLPLHLHHLNRKRINFISFTPGTALDLKHQGGKAEERALLYWMLRRAWGEELFAGARPRNVFQGQVETNRWRRRLHAMRDQEVSPQLQTAFRRTLQRHGRAARGRGEATLRNRFRELLEIYTRADKQVHRRDRVFRNEFVGDLRMLLARACIGALEPDLIILDEFQRFKNLLDPENPAAELASHLFEYGDARVLLLSATPYKMYTLARERETDDHYADFLRTTDFLMQRNNQDFKRELRRYRETLLTLRPETLAAARTACDAIEARLRKVMVRTERLAATPNRQGMLKELQLPPTRLTPVDLRAYLAYDRIAQHLDAGDVLEYWKSAPYLLNYMERGYKLGQLVDHAIAGGSAHPIASALLDPSGSLPAPQTLESWGELDMRNPRLRSITEDSIGRGAWQLLLLPPALSYYEAQAP